jgi:hypothetical protein
VQPITETSPYSPPAVLPVPSRRHLAVFIVLVLATGGLTVGVSEPTVADQPTPPLSLELDYEVTDGPAPDVGVPPANASVEQSPPTPTTATSESADRSRDRRSRPSTTPTETDTDEPGRTPDSGGSTPVSGTPTAPETPTEPTTPTAPETPTEPTTPTTPPVVTTTAPPLTFGNVVPGDAGQVSLTLELNAPARLTLSPSATDFAEGELTEPERNAGDHTAEGELQNYLAVTLWIDTNGDGRRGFGEQLVYSGLAAGLATPDDVAVDGWRCLPAGQYRLGVQWSLPTDTPNVAQTDSVSLSVAAEAAGC